jgi:4-amino-4-deoxy-L-arabinose transferase-like glycosyltransferase
METPTQNATDSTGSKRPLPANKHKIFYSPVWMVSIALAIRVLYIFISQSYLTINPEGAVNEMIRLAYSLATGNGFSDPYIVHTGPSAWTPPIYPWLISLTFRAFGVYSPIAGFVMLLFNSICAALTSWVVYRIARRLFNETLAAWCGWVWVFWPYSIAVSGGVIWETACSAFLLSVLFLLTLKMEDNDSLGWWCGYAALWGIVALINTALVAFLPFSGGWLAWHLYRSGKRLVVPVLASAAVFWLVITPWLARNYVVFGQPVFIRDNFGNEFRSGNNPLAEGWAVTAYHAGSNPSLLLLYEGLSEPAINAAQSRAAKEWIAQNPKAFVVLCFRRFIYFWAGVPLTWTGLARTGVEQAKNWLFLATSLLGAAGLCLAILKRVHGVFLFAALMIFYPLIYYITVPMARFRHPMDPELTILGVFFVWSLLAFARQLTGRSRRSV